MCLCPVFLKRGLEFIIIIVIMQIFTEEGLSHSKVIFMRAR